MIYDFMEAPLALEFRRRHPPAGPLRGAPRKSVRGHAKIVPINAISYAPCTTWLHEHNTEILAECRPAASDSPGRENRRRSGHREGPATKPEENPMVALVAGESRIQKKHKQHTRTHTELRMCKNVFASAEPLGPIIQSCMHAMPCVHAFKLHACMHNAKSPRVLNPTPGLPPAPRPPGQRCHPNGCTPQPFNIHYITLHPHDIACTSLIPPHPFDRLSAECAQPIKQKERPLRVVLFNRHTPCASRQELCALKMRRRVSKRSSPKCRTWKRR